MSFLCFFENELAELDELDAELDARVRGRVQS
jgi:hypothetical protein